jgi:hypothetical protein
MAAGLALKVLIIGAPDVAVVTVAVAVELPALFEAVSVYAVVARGVTVAVPLGDTLPTSGLIEIDVAFVTFHDNVEDWPAKTLAGLELKPLMVGAGSLTLMVFTPVAEPNRLLAASV